ncbi:MAG: hypothetical protein ACYCSQ_02295 [bacterium]
MKLNAVIFSFLFLIFTAVFILIFFPYSYLKKPAELMFSNEYGMRLKIADISSSNLLDLNLSGIKVVNPKNKRIIAMIKNIKVYDAVPAFIGYFLFKKAHLNIKINGIDTNPFKNGFLNIPGLIFKNSFLNININRLKSGAKLTGEVNFMGDLTGKASNINMDIGQVDKINYARLALKPDKKVYKDFLPIFSSAFTKKGEYFIYTAKNMG